MHPDDRLELGDDFTICAIRIWKRYEHPLIGSLVILDEKMKARKAGRPALPKGHAKARIVPVRFNAKDLKLILAAAKSNNQTLSEWIRRTLNAAV